MVHSTGEERAVHLTREAIELVDAGHREAASRNLREALSLAPDNPAVKEAFIKIQEEEATGHHLLDLCRRYTSRKDESAGKDAALYLRTDGLKPPEEVALECAKLLLAHKAHALSSLQDDLISGLVRQNASVRQFFSDKLQISVTTFFDEMYDRGDGAAVCLDTVVLDPSVWPSEAARLHCERELFLLFIAKLMESGHDLDGRSLKGIARLLAVDASKLQDQVDDEELDVILSSLDHRLPLEWRSQATLATVKYLEASKETGQSRFTKLISARLTKGRVDDHIIAFSATAAVFPVIPEIAATLFLSEEFMASLKPVSARDTKRRRVEVSMLELLNAACINKACREAIAKNFSDWLSHTLTNGSDESSELAAVVLAKIRVSDKDAGSNGQVQGDDASVAELVERFKTIMSSRRAENVQNVIEGLAYSSVKPIVKEQLAKDSTFLRDLVKVLHENLSDSSVLYGGLMIIVNITQFLPNLTEEQKKMSQLKSYAEASPDARAGPNPLEKDESVIARCNAVIEAGIMPLFIECSKTNLPSVQGLVSKITLSLSRNQKTRGTLAQQGGVKLLLNIGTSRQGGSGSIANDAVPNASHALARILISVNPSHVFPPSGFPQVTSAIRPLTALLVVPETSADQPRDLLPIFESLLALTNLASHPDESAPDAIVRQAWSVIEDLLLSNSPLIQRAACELVCNLMTCEAGIVKFADGSKRAGQRLHILLALTDADDIATRRAAGGGLAMLTEFDSVVAAVLDKPRGVPLLLRLCQEDDEGLLHRGVACVRNMSCIASGDIGRRAKEALKKGGAVDILSNVLKKSRNHAVLQTGVEALKPLVE
ncbi:myosin-binding striated muscle assembly central-domain-containing protein [Aspergillus minisclerotigenes]|uniref:Myosin-binding striated muscle assembly central-domain-containing protein n=1 Tax=Aspergillus minisclerotigenes TaxID=656917 RepID=A0A5N6J3C9_9EURO|nr:myosin-binding striated muscle assembly central-domain-containing protein [Aspergillus minisclerotigenes]